MKNENVSFDQAIVELESIVKKLEGEVALDESVKLFEKGISLAKICMDDLKAEKGKLSILMDDLNNLTEEFKIEK